MWNHTVLHAVVDLRTVYTVLHTVVDLHVVLYILYTECLNFLTWALRW